MILAFMTAWKALITHSAVPNLSTADAKLVTAQAVLLQVPEAVVAGSQETIRKAPDAALGIPHHLEDLRTFRKCAPEEAAPIDHLPLGSDRLNPYVATPESGAGLHHPHLTSRTRTDPPLPAAPDRLRAHLQTWRI
ncbi:hypothetical protein ACFY2N_21755 [Streptomyces rubiginosohelvolus]|uniref:hypothetical protein n=1 Tax=Streptomyces rubiginosohelvolus TaxID=67362 RepID=UPI00367829EC